MEKNARFLLVADKAVQLFHQIDVAHAFTHVADTAVNRPVVFLGPLQHFFQHFPFIADVQAHGFVFFHDLVPVFSQNIDDGQ